MKKTPSILQLVAPVGFLASRFAVGILVTSSIVLLLLSRTNSDFVRGVRLGLTEVALPIVDVIAKPFDALATFNSWLDELATLRADNIRLKSDNARLLKWQEVAKEMVVENAGLRELMHYEPLAQLSYISARIVTDGAGPFARAAVISAGVSQGVKKDQAVIGATGLVGRVIEAGPSSSRVLLITDINSRIPIIGENSRERAILSGDNTELPLLRYLPDNSKLADGEVMLTAGDGKLIPPGLPVGVATRMDNGQLRVYPLADWYKLEYVSVVDFSF